MGNCIEAFGVIKPPVSLEKAEKLNFFRNELILILNKHKPSDVVIERVFVGSNPSVSMFLGEFGGVAKEAIYDVLNINSVVIDNNKIKSYFGVRDKKSLFNKIVDLFDISCFVYSKHNDITDSMAICIYYYYNFIENKPFSAEICVYCNLDFKELICLN